MATLDDIGEAAERAAARVRRRYPTREPDPASLAASQGAVTLGQLLGGDPRAAAAEVYYGGDYDPRSVIQSIIGTVGAPAVGPATTAATLGAGLIRRAPIAAPVELGAYPTTTAGRILNKTKGGGYSVNIPSGEIPTEGIMAGIYRNTDPRNLVIEGRQPTLADIRAFGERNLEALQKAERHFGTWLDPDTGITYLDVSQRFPAGAVRPATKFAERTAQKSIYDVGAGQTLPVGSWQEFIQGPEFRQRMDILSERGAKYLQQFPQREWWDMYGSPFEAAYGPERLPNLAGFMASTAPNTAPRPNIQQASEYMRRLIRGEPVVQPGWRAPEGLMNLAPGKQMPLEASRIANLEKSAAGNLTELQRDKVRSEALAMMGDPNAMVFDRHWARAAEKPSEGIYTSSQEGVVGSAPRKGRTDYQMLGDVVSPIAKAAGRNPRDYSADVWTGIRDTIQKTGELFGEKFRGSAIAGESKSYADHFVDIVNEKAKHLGMSAQELEKRLREGDASLLSVMLSAPTIGAAYRYWSAGQNGSASNQGDRATPASP